jgi:subtilisin family serine protease
VSEPRWEDIDDPTIRDQVQYIREQFARKGVAAEFGEAFGTIGKGGIDVGVEISGGGVAYMYAEGQILVREPYLAAVQDILQRQPSVKVLRPGRGKASKTVLPRAAGVAVIYLKRQEDGNYPPVPELLAQIDGVLGPGYATPNHVLTVCGGQGGPCPATEPEEAYAGIEPYPSVSPGGAGEGISVYMADTGLLRYKGDELDPSPTLGDPQVVTNRGEPHWWLAGVKGTLDRRQVMPGGRNIRPYEGHGTFVAGVARCMAPKADIYVENVFKIAGSSLETHLARRLDAALAYGYDLFHLSIAAPTRKDLPLISFEAWLRRLRQYKGVACVVAAGNSGLRLPTWPAAFPEAVAVGALAADWRSRALFSNYGPWVDVYAPGRDLINAFAYGTYKCHTYPYKDRERHFYGMAKWSGTSFSTPVVTGLIAARMWRTGENGLEAAASLLAEARSAAIPGVGPILLPYHRDPAWPVSQVNGEA